MTIFDKQKKQKKMEKLRLVLSKIETCIELQNGATESQLKSMWNDISDFITEQEELKETTE